MNKYYESCYNELILALQNNNKRPDNHFFSIGRDIIHSLPQQNSLKEFVNSIPSYQQIFKKQNTLYLSSLSSDDRLVFFDTAEKEITIDNLVFIQEYLFDEAAQSIIIRLTNTNCD